MSSSIITKVIEEMNDLPDDLQQQVLKFVLTLWQQPLQTCGNAWDVLESLTGTVEASADWSAEHGHYLYSTPKRQEPESWAVSALLDTAFIQALLTGCHNRSPFCSSRLSCLDAGSLVKIRHRSPLAKILIPASSWKLIYDRPCHVGNSTKQVHW